MTSRPRRDIAIIGAGISGLTLAYRLKQLGHKVKVFESNSRPGGVMQSHKQDEWLMECGPNTVLLKDQAIKSFIDDIGLGDQLLFANEKANKRFILRDGKLREMPSKPLPFLTSSLFSVKGKFNIIKEMFVKAPEDHNYNEESLGNFVRRRFGQEFLDYAINPFVAGVFAGDPDNLAVVHAFEKLVDLERNYGSVIGGAIKGAKERKKAGRKDPHASKIFSFPNGISQLTDYLASFLTKEIQYGVRVSNVQPKYFIWSLKVISNGRVREERFDKVIFATSAKQLDQIDGPWVSLPVSKIPQPPVSVVSLGYPKKAIKHKLDGFGFLVPEKEKRKILGCLFSSTLFEHRAPAGSALLTAFVGGTRQPQYAKMGDERIKEMVHAELRDILGISTEPTFSHIRRWESAIPQYTIGYERIKTYFKLFEEENKDLYFCGNYLNGISVGDCILNALKLADRIEEEN